MFEPGDAFKKLRSLAIPVRGPYHAPHIYSPSELITVIPPKSIEILARYKLHPTKLVGLDNPKSAGVLDVFNQAIHQMLRECLAWESCIEDYVKSAREIDVQLISMGSSIHSNGMASLLKNRLSHGTVPELSTKDYTKVAGSPGSFNEAKIAVVGMAGRFPNATSHEELWSLIEKGFDTHRTVSPPTRTLFETENLLLSRYHRIDGIFKLIQIPAEKGKIKVTPHMGASLIILGFSTIVSSICPLEKRHRQILCRGLPLLPPTKP